MKFLVLAILPAGVDAADDARVEAEVDRMMAPWRLDPDGAPESVNLSWAWDGYSPRAGWWLAHLRGEAVSPEEEDRIVRLDPADLVAADFLPTGRAPAAVVLAPDGAAEVTGEAYRRSDAGWPTRAAAAARAWSGHSAVLVLCRE